MASVVFLRGVNVGGHRVFRPSLLVAKLSHLGVVNVGAAGTFVVRKPTSASQVRREFLEQLPFEAELMLCSGREVSALVRSRPFGTGGPKPGVKWFVNVLARKPRRAPPLPLLAPPGEPWEMNVFACPGRFALSLWRRLRPRFLMPATVIEPAFGVRCTTRSWSTFVALDRVLSAPGAASRPSRARSATSARRSRGARRRRVPSG